jgi:hypothetical protein
MQERFQLGTGFPEQLWERLFTEFREKGGSLLLATEHQPIRSWIPDSAIIIALITFGAYFVAFTHELGFCHYLNIPYQFISMNLNIIWYTSLPLIYAISMLFFGYIITVIVTFMGQRILRFISALVPQGMRDHVNLESTEAATAPRPLLPNQAIHQRAVAAIFAGFVFFLIIFAFGIISYINGRNSAHTQQQKELHIIAQPPDIPEVVVLQIYGDYLLTATFDRATKVIKKQLYILKVSEMAKTPLTTEKVGPLQVNQ